MIDSLTALGRYILVIGGSHGNHYINHTTGALGVGQMRFNTTSQSMEFYDGTGWQQLQQSQASVQLDSEAINLLDWVKEKRDEERRLKQLIETIPAVKIAYDAVLKAEEQLKITTILSKDESPTN
jgi:hypothetical protein